MFLSLCKGEGITGQIEQKCIVLLDPKKKVDIRIFEGEKWKKEAHFCHSESCQEKSRGSKMGKGTPKWKDIFKTVHPQYNTTTNKSPLMPNEKLEEQAVKKRDWEIKILRRTRRVVLIRRWKIRVLTTDSEWNQLIRLESPLHMYAHKKPLRHSNFNEEKFGGTLVTSSTVYNTWIWDSINKLTFQSCCQRCNQ